MSDATSDHARVLVVGAGPAGLVAGITLARYGVPVLLAEKRYDISTLSRALVVSTRSMELLRSWGLEEKVRAGAADVEPCGWRTRTLACGTGAEIPLGYPAAAQAARVSPTRPAWVPQDHLEPLLLARLRGEPSSEVRFGTELIALSQDDDGVRVTVRDHRSGQPRDLETRYVIGADGAHSRVRAELGIRMEGSDETAEYHSVQFRAPLGRVLGDRRYGINMITHPDAAGVLASRGPDDRWHYGREWRPGQVRLVDCAKEEIARLIAIAIGAAEPRPRIGRVSAFPFSAQIAGRYRDRRCFLVGDAAHRMSPRGGTGMNTAIQDAYDLGWKLAWVLNGWAEPSLLDSYEADRRPVGLHNVTLSGDPDGARQQAREALTWDLNGRLAHRWLRYGERTVSTLDLLGDGLTLLTGPGGAPPRYEEATPHPRVPVTIHKLDELTASALEIAPGEIRLLRPDGKALQ
jgi:putative polyketide hydroxylase